MCAVNLFFFLINARATKLQLEHPDRNKNLERLVSFFSKAYALHESDKVRMKQKKQYQTQTCKL